MTLDEFMLTNGISNGVLAKHLKCCSSFISLLRNRRKNPSLIHAVKIVAYSNYQIDYRKMIKK